MKIKNETFKSQFIVLQNFLERKINVKVHLIEGAYDAWYPLLKIIRINSNLKWRERFFTLLHEAGHALLDTDTEIQKKICFSKHNPQRINSKVDFIHTINNEVMAWNKGQEIAELMNFELNKEQYEKYMTRCMMSHVKMGLKNVYGKEIDVSAIDIR